MAKLDPLDTLFSEFIRRRALARVGGCERCLAQKHDSTRENGSTRPAYMDLQCSHFHGRARRSVRWDEDNAAGLCGACHMFLGSHPYEHVQWFKERLGKNAYDMLWNRMRIRQKPDRAALGLYYKVQITLLQESE